MRSKWSLKRYTIDNKEVRKLSPWEIVEATCETLDIDLMTTKDHRALLVHLGFLAQRAKNDVFKESAHAEYDLTVRKRALREGFEAFRTGNEFAAISRYNYDNLRGRGDKNYKRLSKRRAHSPSKGVTKDGKAPCYTWNSREGCSRENCFYSHHCSKCGKGHRLFKCTD